MKNFPIKKEFELKINIKRKVLFFNKTKTIILKYSEASVLEIIDFLQSEKQIIEYFSDFIFKNSNATKEDLAQILLSFDKIWDKLNNTFLEGLNNNKETQVKTDLSEENSGTFNSYIVLLSEKLSLDPLSLLKKYTLKQFNYLTEGIVYNLNNQTKKGQQENRMNDIRKQRENLNDKDAKTIKNFIYSD